MSPTGTTVAIQAPMQSAQARHQELFGGLLLYIVFEYIRFAEWIPALQPLHLQRLIALSTLTGFAFFYKGSFRHPRIMLYILCLTVVSAVFNLGNLWFTGAQRFFIALIKATATYYLLINLLTETEHFKKFLTVYLASNIVLVFAGLLQGGYKGALSEGIFASGFVSDSNDYALAVNVVLPFFWYFFIYARRTLHRVLFCTGFLMSLVAVIYSFSRGGFLGLCAALLFAIMKSKERMKYTLICLLAVGLTAALAPPSYWDRINTISSSEESDDGRSSSEMRLNLWKIGITMVEEHPFFGVGPGNFPFKIVQYGGKVVPDEDDLLFLADRLTHNTFINTASELGLIGFFLYMTLIVKTYKNAEFCEKIVRKGLLNGNSWLRGLPQAIETSIVSYSVTSFFITSYLYPHIYLLSAMALALRGHCLTRLREDI